MVVATLRGGLKLRAVEFPGVDLFIVERFKGGRVAAGIDCLEVLIRIEPGFA